MFDVIVYFLSSQPSFGVFATAHNLRKVVQAPIILYNFPLNTSPFVSCLCYVIGKLTVVAAEDEGAFTVQ